ncbi:MAG: NUMOD3 domain-containing DNA-binding protein [Bacteroidota bacterium]|jgi:group I intron endonuclease
MKHDTPDEFPSILEILVPEETLGKLCLCGCKRIVKPGPGKRFAGKGCNKRFISQQKIESPGLCPCGCNQVVKPGNEYATSGCCGRLGGILLRKVRSLELLPLCPCGCNRKVKPGRKYAARGCANKGILRRRSQAITDPVEGTSLIIDPKGPRCGIYMIRNTLNGKVYIGQSSNIRARWRNHRLELNGGRHINSYLQRSWTKHGGAVFEFSILVECPECELGEYESIFVQKFDALNRDKGYNLIAQIGSRRIVSQDTRDKMSASLKGHPTSVETRAKISIAHTGMKYPPGRKMSKPSPLKGRVQSDETRAKNSAGHKGKKHTPETRAKMSKDRKGVSRSPKTGI